MAIHENGSTPAPRIRWEHPQPQLIAHAGPAAWFWLAVAAGAIVLALAALLLAHGAGDAAGSLPRIGRDLVTAIRQAVATISSRVP